jgi:hypothetical protein
MGYLGSKEGAGTFQTIIAQMPPHDTYIESHLGSGAIFRHKPLAARSILIDLDPATLADVGPIAVKKKKDLLDGLVETYCTDATAFLQNFDYRSAGRTLIYADPPYLWATRTSSHRYKHDYTHLDHVALLQTLAQVPASVILSGYPHPLYDSMLPGWRTLEFQAMTRGGPRTEKLWMNFAAGAVHWASFAGANRTQRQMIKRKAARWAVRFAKCPLPERLAILSALHACPVPAPGPKPDREPAGEF